MNINGVLAWQVENAVVRAAEQQLGVSGGSLETLVDHIMICLPSGTVMDNGGNNFIAYGYVDGAITVYNDGWCRYLSTQMVRACLCIVHSACMLAGVHVPMCLYSRAFLVCLL